MKQVFFKRLGLALCIGMLAFSAHAQYPPITLQNLGNGEVDYTSNLTADYLHFYMYGDGYYAWQQSPNNIFEYSNTGYTTRFYSVENKDPVEPDLFFAETGPTGYGYPTNNPLSMLPNIHVKASWNVTDYAETFILLNFENKFNPTTTSGCVEFIYRESDLLVNLDSVIVKDGWADNMQVLSNKIRWDFENLAPHEQRVIYIPVISLKPPGHNTIIRGKIKDGCSGPGLSQSGFVTVNAVPHDPNYIRVKNVPDLSFSEHLEIKYEESEQYLIYETQFHNIGPGTVQDVLVRVEFEDNYEIEGASVTEATHDLVIADFGNNYIEFFFEDINLPGFNANVPFEDASSKFSFEICLEDYVQGGFCTGADVQIYFDQQEPIYGECTMCAVPDAKAYNNPCSRAPHGFISVLGDFRSSENAGRSTELNISPNPTIDVLNVDIDDRVSVIEMQITDFNGKIISALNSDQRTFDIHDLSPGVYVLRVVTDDGPMTKIFTKQ